MNVNKIIITGNLTADPELRYTPSGKAVLSASIANNEHFTDAQGQEQKVTTFVNLEVWGRPAENFGKLVRKGQELFVDGKLRMDEWTDKQTNARRTRLYLLVENWQFTQFKRQEESTPDGLTPVGTPSPMPTDTKRTQGKGNK
jgi:single-strand DNA-binding protein